jgi:outer membrane protein TolC
MMSETRARGAGWGSRGLVAVCLLAAVPAAAEQAPAAIDLEAALARAVARNERARIADSQAAAAEARLSRARAAFLPELTLAGTYTRRAQATTREVAGETVTVQSQNALAGSLSLGVSLFDARNFPLHRQARLERDAARLQALDDKRRVAFDAADAYVAALGLEQVVTAAERRLTQARAAEEDARRRVAAQLVSSNDLTRAELERTTAERELTAARADLDTGYLQLGFLIDAEIRGPLVAPAALLETAAAPAADVAALVAEARRRRLDIAAGHKRAAALHAFADEPQGRLWPSLSALGQLRATNEAGLSGRDTDWSVALTATWILFDGGERYAERRERLAEASGAAAEATAAERQIDIEVRSAVVALGRSQAAVAQAEAVVAAAQKNAAETIALYRQGLARALEVADANAQLFEAEVALARERYGMAVALLALRVALGVDPLGREVVS